MKGMDRYYDDYNPGPYSAAGVYNSENFRVNLAEFLKLKNLTQAEAARCCDIEPQMINYWLTGRSEPNLFNFTKLCSGLEVEPNWLLAKHEPIRKGRSDR